MVQGPWSHSLVLVKWRCVKWDFFQRRSNVVNSRRKNRILCLDYGLLFCCKLALPSLRISRKTQMKGCSCQPSCVPSLLSNFSLLLQSRVLLHEIYSIYTTGSPSHLKNFAASARGCGSTWGPRVLPSGMCCPRPAVAPAEIQSEGGAAAMMPHEAAEGTRDGSAEPGGAGGAAGGLPQGGEALSQVR